MEHFVEVGTASHNLSTHNLNILSHPTNRYRQILGYTFVISIKHKVPVE